jgi:hypothetical protein
MRNSIRTMTLAAVSVALFVSADVEAQTHILDQLSGTSLRLTIRHDNIEIGTGTGFVLQKGQRYYLITNRHIVLACAEDKNPNNVGGWLCANNLLILHNKLNHVGEWIRVEEKLLDEHNTKRWLEHPTLGSAVDLVALPLTKTEGVAFLPLNLDLRKTDIRIQPGDAVSIVGFPFGIAQVGGLAIWKVGTIASDIDIDIEGKSRFLLDTTARPGMSGSPVYVRRSGGYQTARGSTVLGENATKFLGVFAEESQAAEIGVVWKAEVVQSLYDSLP